MNSHQSQSQTIRLDDLPRGSDRDETKKAAIASRPERDARPEVERLETHLALNSILVVGPASIPLPVGVVHKGDVIQFRGEDWRISDQDEAAE